MGAIGDSVLAASNREFDIVVLPPPKRDDSIAGAALILVSTDTDAPTCIGGGKVRTTFRHGALFWPPRP
jgi:hypothetical protein